VPHFNIPIFYQGKLVITIHDLLWHEYRGLQVTTLNPLAYLLKYLAYRWVTARAIAKAQAILVPAQTIKKTILKYYPQVKSKIFVTHEGINNKFLISRPEGDPSLRDNFKFLNNSRTLVYLGSLYPHKNIKVVLQALKKLPNYKLKLIGARDVFSRESKKLIDQYQVNSQVKFLGFLEDAQVAKELKTSLALVQPSLSEGFGLTGVEAMSAGTPVIASKIPIFQEIYQDGAIYFDPHDPQSFVCAVQKLEKTNLNKLLQKAKKIAASYSWDKMVQETLQVYASCLSL